jgi:thioredoxin 1
MNFATFLNKNPDQELAAQASAGIAPKSLNAHEFQQLLAESQVPVVVDFWAEWCGPCHMMSPSVAQLATEFGERAVVAKLNADDYPEILGQYGIMGIPTIIYFQQGREVDRVVGVTRFNVLKAKLEKLMLA